jgi:iron complex transport system substrate-binding protein
MLALQPDLVFVASYSNPETVRYLLRSGISIVRLGEFTSFANIFKNIRIVANVTDSQEKGEAIIRSTQQRIDFIKNQVKDQAKPRILYYDLNGYSVGGNTLTDEAIRLAGGINVTNGIIADGENKISEELAISLQPDVIVLNQWVLNHKQGEVSPAQQLKAKQAWQDVPAVKNNKVYSIPGSLLRSVSQHRIKGVEMMAKLIHPKIEIYQEKTDVQ